MGKKVQTQPKLEATPMSDAVAQALRETIPPRKIAEASELTGIPHSTLRRLMEGQKRVTAAQIQGLRRWPAFGPRFDALAGNTSPEPGYIEAAKILAETAGESDAVMFAIRIKALAAHMPADEILALIQEATEREERRRARQAAEKKSPESALLS